MRKYRGVVPFIHHDIHYNKGRHSRESGNPGRYWIPGRARNDKLNKTYAVLFFLAISVFLFAAVGETQEKAKTRKEEGKKSQTGAGFGFSASRGPIDITSDTVEYDQRQNTITFKGNVIAKQEDTTLFANTVVVYNDSQTKKLKDIVATGNVKIVQLERRATGQKATFHQEENKIILDGDAVVREGENVVRGERVIYFVDEERSVVEGGKGGRVSTTITPSKRE